MTLRRVGGQLPGIHFSGRSTLAGQPSRPSALSIGWHLGPQQGNRIKKRVDYNGREKAAATPPQFAGNEAEHDCFGGHNGATLEVDNAEERSGEQNGSRHRNSKAQEGSLPPFFQE